MNKLFKSYKPWMQKSHFNYFLLVLFLYALSAFLYFVTSKLSWVEPVAYSMEIDEAIPFISYFYFFYAACYIVPGIILWKLSYFDKRKFFIIFIAIGVSLLICSISYCFYQVIMMRPDLSMYESLSSVNSLDSFFRHLIYKLYQIDDEGINCLPSMHTIFAGSLILLTFPTSKGERYIPFTMRISCFVFGFGIAMSAFFIKQHYFIDVIVSLGTYSFVYYVTLFVIKKKYDLLYKRLDELSDVFYKDKEPFDPKETKFPYKEYTDQHYLKITKDRGLVFDENYAYVDKRLSFRILRFLGDFTMQMIVFPFSRIRNGLKIKGKNNYVKHRKELKKGFFTFSNHINMWDYIAIMKALGPYKAHVLVWDQNVNGQSGALVKLVGGIPIPEHSLKGTLKYISEVKELVNTGHYVHIYAEGCMWEYYQPIRPFKHGGMLLAKKLDKPALPLAFSYRKPSWIRKHIFKQSAALTLTVGEPLYINKELPENEQTKDLTIRLHEAVCRLANIDPKKNIYPPIFENSKRIDYYDLKTK